MYESPGADPTRPSKPTDQARGEGYYDRAAQDAYDPGTAPGIDPGTAGVLGVYPKAGDVVVISERTLHGALRWQPRDRDRRFLTLRYNVLRRPWDAAPQNLFSGGQERRVRRRPPPARRACCTPPDCRNISYSAASACCVYKMFLGPQITLLGARIVGAGAAPHAPGERAGAVSRGDPLAALVRDGGARLAGEPPRAVQPFSSPPGCSV
jgi:hypothetical protein